MATSEYDVRVVPSVFDRLIDEQPDAPPLPPRETVRRLRAAVQRDLEFLLNSRSPLFDLASEFVQTGKSVAAYGLPDLTALNAGSPSDMRRLRQIIENALAAFEPRLLSPAVAITPPVSTDPVLRLRVSAQLVMDPAPEPVTFDVVMPLATRRYEVREARA